VAVSFTPAAVIRESSPDCRSSRISIPLFEAERFHVGAHLAQRLKPAPMTIFQLAD
jgi:hypothetical protein